MSAAFTPGPWMAAASPSSVVGWPVVRQGVGRAICGVSYLPKEANAEVYAESEANAHLIAAAPDGYVAADALDDWAVAKGMTTDSYCEFCDQHAPKDTPGNIIGPVEHESDCPLALARAFLAKARGEQ